MTGRPPPQPAAEGRPLGRRERDDRVGARDTNTRRRGALGRPETECVRCRLAPRFPRSAIEPAAAQCPSVPEVFENTRSPPAARPPACTASAGWVRRPTRRTSHRIWRGRRPRSCPRSERRGTMFRSRARLRNALSKSAAPLGSRSPAPFRPGSETGAGRSSNAHFRPRSPGGNTGRARADCFRCE